MEKFELKHFSSYPMGENGVLVRLPKHQIEYGKYHTYPLNGIFISFQNELGIELLTPDEDTINSFTFELNKCKLVLRPLSDLTKEIEVNGEKFIPMQKLYHEMNLRIAGLSYYGIEQRIIKKPLVYLTYQYIEYLFQWHFDVYGLIERGLAIDMNNEWL